MISSIFNTLIHDPLYNGLVLLMNLMPWADVGVIIVIFTFLVKLILFPLSQTSVKTQMKMKLIEPEVNHIKEKHKNDKEQLAKATMNLYREKNINPFSGFLVILIQIPIIFSLYFIFLRGGLPEVDMNSLYSFVSVPENVSVLFLGLVDVSKRSLILALITGVTQYIQIRLAIPKAGPRKDGATFGEDLARSMQLQMRYVMPVIVFFVSYSISAAIALYWTTSNLFHIGQEIFVRKRFAKKEST